jgi:hypothetical protein
LHSNWATRPAQRDAWISLSGPSGLRASLTIALFSTLIFVLGCRTSHHSRNPSIQFTRVPKHVSVGGPGDFDPINGSVSDSKPGEKIMIYSLTEGTWWVQPFGSRGLTEIGADGKWSNVSHLGEQYAALLVNGNYKISARLPKLPSVGGDVLAVATTPGDFTRPPAPKSIHFSGYDWLVRSGGGDVGGAFCDYKSSNVWVDDKGYLHLLMGEDGGEWHCAGLMMTHSLGYGSYRFVVADSAHFPPSPRFDMFMRPDHEDPDERSGFSIAMGQGGKPNAPNAEFVVQPYYVPGNSVHFNAPSGIMSYVLRWEPGNAAFKAFSGVSATPRGAVKEQVFRTGIPVPAEETVHFNFYDYHHTQSGLRQPVEIVVEKFEYLP